MLKLLALFILMILICSLLWLYCDSFYHYFITPKQLQEPIVFRPYGFLHKFFIDLPKQIGIDRANFDRNSFSASGLIIFTGKQGFGKTISMVEYASKLKATFPESKVISNTDLIFQNAKIDSWQPLTSYNNGKYGVIACLDEISIWFSNRNFKNFPPEMLQVITQNRKNRRVILGTAQNLSMVDKSIRLQCTEQRKCMTFFGCLTVVFRSIPEFDCEGNLVKSKFKSMYWFVQSDFLRSCYDTYSVIDTLNKVGFKERIDING